MFRQVMRGRLTWAGLLIATAYWPFEAMIHTHIFQQGLFLEQLLSTDPNEFQMRLVTTLLLILFGVMAQIGAIHQRQALVAAHEHDRRFGRILNTTSEAFVIMSSKGQIVDWNSRAESMFGWSKKEAVGRSLAELIIPPDLRPLHEQGYRRFIESGQPALSRRLETTALHKNGHLFPVEFSVSFLADEVDGVFFGFLRDITDRVQAEQAFQAIVESVAKGSGHEFFIGVSQQLCQWLGVDCVAFVEIVKDNRMRTLGMMLDGKETAPFEYGLEGSPCATIIDKGYCLYSEGVQGQFPQDAYLAEFGAEGYAGVPIMDSHGEILGLLCAISRRPLHPPPRGRDLLRIIAARAAVEIRRSRAEEALMEQASELARSNEELRQFAYVASHDLQEPLRMVASYTQLLDRRYRGKMGDEADDFIHFVVDGAKRMQLLINDLLTFSRVDSGPAEFEPVDFHIVLIDALRNLQAAIEESGAVITQDAMPVVRADAAQMRQLFQNLIGNAIKFHDGRPPKVHIGAEYREDQWVFSVRDHGIGMEPEQTERIFLIFQRLHGRDQYSGSGIGLAICRKIVDRHHGRIWVESQPGKGATFLVGIPDKGE
ncbi:MAG: PAS domain S-box protein [Mariprofundaceae bacterium]